MQVACPRCSTQLEADPAQRDHLGRIRLGCGDCGAMVLVKVRAPALRVAGDIPTADGDEAAARGGLDFTVLEVTTEVDDRSDADAAAWVVVIEDLGGARITAVRTVLMRIPRFSGNLNKLQDQLEYLPFVLSGISSEESERLAATIGVLGGRCRAGPEASLLDRAGRPLPEDEVEAWEPEDADSGGPAAGLAEVVEADEEYEVDDEDEDEDEDDFDIDINDEVDPAPELPEPPVSTSVLLATVDHIPGLDDVLGLVSAAVVVPVAGGQGVARLEAAVAEAQDRLGRKAAEQNAAAVVAVRTTSATLADGSLLLVMQGTATA